MYMNSHTILKDQLYAWTKSHYQLLGDARKPLPMRPGDNQKTDSEYVRNGTCSIFAFVEPLGGTHHVSVREQRTAFDWAEEIKYLVDVMYPDAEKVILVMVTLTPIKRRPCIKGIQQMRQDELSSVWKFTIHPNMEAGLTLQK